MVKGQIHEKKKGATTRKGKLFPFQSSAVFITATKKSLHSANENVKP